MPRWLKIILKSLGGLLVMTLLLLGGLSLYISFNKAKVLRMVNAQLLKSVNGTVAIGDISPQFVKGFPNVSLRLKNVLIRDKRYAAHHRTLLNAQDFEMAVNARQLLNGVIDIEHITINNAAIDVYTDSTGYSNTAVFNKDTAKPNTDEQSSSAQLQKFSMGNIELKIDDQKSQKLFDFALSRLDGQLSYPDSGFTASIHLAVLTKSMTFSMPHGSFLKNKLVEGKLTAGYNKKTGNISVYSPRLQIGEDPFELHAGFVTAKPAPAFTFHLSCDQLYWRHASALLTNNITLKLNQFNIAQPINVKAIISGSFDGGGDPYLYITAAVKNNTVSIPGAQIAHCSFNGIFTNSYAKGKTLGDENSVIRLNDLKGNYLKVPFQIDSGSIVNLIHPIATGNLKTTFPLTALNQFIDRKVLFFNKGTANINLNYKGDIVDFRINKPLIAGDILINNAGIDHVSSGLKFTHTSASLSFVKNDLFIKNTAIQTGRSKVQINAQVNNFLNFYYTAPEKIVFNCSIRSPQIYLGEFIGFLNNGAPAAKSSNSGDIIKQMTTVLNRCQVAVDLKADQVHYNKFLATKVKAQLRTLPRGVIFKNVGLNTSGGSIQLNGAIKQTGLSNQISVQTIVTGVNVRDFFYSFDSFGLKDLTYQNLSGQLSAKTNVALAINNKAALLPKTINGTLKVNLKNAALLNFKGLQGVIKLAFPFRDFKTIRIPNLDADFAVRGDKIEILPLQLSSSILNADIAGTYGLTNGTNITLDVPLRNPKNDSTITDQAQLQKKRYRGIVLHLLAKADETGKIKIGFNKGHKETDTN